MTINIKALILLGILMLLLCINDVIAQSNEEKYKTIYVYQFSKFMSWPVEAQQPGKFVIGILGDCPVLKELEAMAKSKSSAKLTYVIKPFSSVSDISTDCNMVYICDDKSNLIESVNRRLQKTSTLTVTEKEGLTRKGYSNVNLVLVDGKLKMIINKEGVAQRKIRVSNQLLKLAIVV